MNPPTGPDVESCARLAAGGDGRAFAGLVAACGDRVARCVAAHVPPGLVRELTQEAFVRAWRSLPSWRGETVWPWLRTIAVRACHDYWRAEGRRRETPLSQLPEGTEEWLAALPDGLHDSRPEGGPGLEAHLERAEAGRLLDWALAQLSATDRMVVGLVHLEELSVAEAAGLLGISAANVKVRAFRARRRLRTLLEEAMVRPPRRRR